MEARTVTPTPGQAPGDSSPKNPLPIESLICICGDDLRASHLLHGLPLNLDLPTTPLLTDKAYKTWIDSLKAELCPEAQQLVDCWAFSLLEKVYNCGAAHTLLFGKQVDHTRRDHCIHAAYSVQGLLKRATLDLSEHEAKVLELSLVLHDMHRLGSHALDHVYASIPGAPPIENWGWSKDFHEYHGARLVAQDKEIRAILGELSHDVLAVLSYPDKRSESDPSRIADYGVVKPTLSKERLHLLHTLKDEADRNSYNRLDYGLSGFLDHLTSTVIALIEKYESAMDARSGRLQVQLQDQSAGRHALPFDGLIAARQLFREHIATHPVSTLVDSVLREAVWKTILEKFPDRLNTKGCYHFVRNIALEGSYAKLFGRDVLEMLNAPRMDGAVLGLEDRYAPLITMTLDDLSEVSGQSSIGQRVPPGLAEQICGYPRADMTLFEYRVRDALKKAGLNSNVMVVLTNDIEKVFEFKVSDRQNMIEIGRLAVRTSKQAVKVIIAAEALDEDGLCKHLAQTQSTLKRFLLHSKLLRSPSVVEKYNPRVFCEPFEPELFKPEVREYMSKITPAWIKRGGCGLV